MACLLYTSIQGIHRFINFYNNERPHATLQYKTPVQKEQEYWDKKKESSLELEFRVQNRYCLLYTSHLI